MRFFWGTILLAIGLFFVIKTDSILRLNGRVNWAELHLHTLGGTRTLYKLIGLVLIFISFLLYTGLAGTFFLWILSPIFNLGF